MKPRLLLLLALVFSVSMFGQKKELKSLEKLVKSGSFSEAKTVLTSLDGMLDLMDEKTKAKYYLLKGQTFLGSPENLDGESLKTAIDMFSKVNDDKLNAVLEPLKVQAINQMVNSAVEDQNAKEYDKAAAKLYDLYKMSPKDTMYLYFAASNSVNSSDYDSALTYYNELKDLGYSGIETKYMATNKETGVQENLGNEQTRDLMVKAGEYIDPETVVTESKASEVTKNIALIYASQGKNEEAIAAIQDAKLQNPGDISLLKSEAEVYLSMGMDDKYEETLTKVIEMDPENPQLYYNLGVTAGKAKKNDKAIEYYKKAIALKPEYVEANLNLAAVMLQQDQVYIEEMNGLGMSNADNKKYDSLKAKRMDLYRAAVPYLLTAHAGKPENADVIRTLYNIYTQLGDTEATKSFKAKLDSLSVD